LKKKVVDQKILFADGYGEIELQELRQDGVTFKASYPEGGKMKNFIGMAFSQKAYEELVQQVRENTIENFRRWIVFFRIPLTSIDEN